MKRRTLHVDCVDDFYRVSTVREDGSEEWVTGQHPSPVSALDEAIVALGWKSVPSEWKGESDGGT